MSIKSGTKAALSMSATSKSLIHGVGVNDADYVVRPKGVMCKYYSVWSSMIDRCYNDKNKNYYSYSDCSVCDEWLLFSAFKVWMDNQDFDGMCLDKDLIKVGNKIYCPEFCAFVTREANNLVLHKKENKNGLPTGVHLNKRNGKFISELRVNGSSVRVGTFTDKSEAFKAYVDKKTEVMFDVASRQLDKRVGDGISLHAKALISELSHDY